MLLIPDEERTAMLENGRREAAGEPFEAWPLVKLFTPDEAATWLLSSLDPCHSFKRQPQIADGGQAPSGPAPVNAMESPDQRPWGALEFATTAQVSRGRAVVPHLTLSWAAITVWRRLGAESVRDQGCLSSQLRGMLQRVRSSPSEGDRADQDAHEGHDAGNGQRPANGEALVGAEGDARQTRQQVGGRDHGRQHVHHLSDKHRT